LTERTTAEIRPCARRSAPAKARHPSAILLEAGPAHSDRRRGRIVLGATLAFLVAFILSHALGINWQFVFPWSGAIMGISVSAVIGLVFCGIIRRARRQEKPGSRRCGMSDRLKAHT